MEYCAGGDLYSWLTSHFKKLTEPTAREIMKKLLSAVNHCHSNNIAHRDLKPENIMFTAPFTDQRHIPELKIIDFGLGKLF